MTIMVTGGAGFIGAHTCVELIRAGYSVVVLDNFCNSHGEVLNRIKRISGVLPVVVRGDVRDREAVVNALEAHRCSAVIHLAGLKSAADSFSRPLQYYDNNVLGTLSLIQAMQRVGVEKLVFSSSAAVYGEPMSVPIKEDHALSPLSPYGRTKLIVEQMLGDITSGSVRTAVLRYFNPVGSHQSGLIGDDPRAASDNIMLALADVATGRRSHLNVFGNDYETSDGTGVRDYIHVMDLAAAHLRALQCVERRNPIKLNLGTGRGSSVLELVRAFSRASGKDIPLVFAPRRDGDVSCAYACPDLARRVLDWRATRDLDEMCADAWKWQSNNPGGYGILE
jgi:UDP-glucose 4-epimerase